MRHILFLLSIQSIQLGSSFDLPQPLDNFYDEVVRFYKRLRQEGGKLTTNFLIYRHLGQYSYHHKLNPCPKYGVKFHRKGLDIWTAFKCCEPDVKLFLKEFK